MKPANGGIPDIDKNTSTTVIETKLYLLKIFKFDKVFIFLMSYKNNKLKNRYSINIYKYIYLNILWLRHKQGLKKKDLKYFEKTNVLHE